MHNLNSRSAKRVEVERDYTGPGIVRCVAEGDGQASLPIGHSSRAAQVTFCRYTEQSARGDLDQRGLVVKPAHVNLQEAGQHNLRRSKRPRVFRGCVASARKFSTGMI